ncbi:hypothetical protein Ddye_003790 [Dipteronia dyeriana]|uniref:RNase H type-1 domain-containing protein n=1 Tax=Dipteronia dyeriana TaxID=168575 RepID=A0AAE0CVP9_9ROSI|nr:hypothetical protein Ddye_003790 [Dipteronia dyeriana]
MIVADFELLCVTWWCIWFRRNNFVHSSILLLVNDLLEWVVKFLRDFQLANVKEESVHHPNYGIVSWSPSPIGYFKINTDATLSFSDKISGIGVVIRDSGGRVMACLCGNARGFYEPQIAKAKVILRGFLLALETGLYPAILESDDLSVVNLIKAKEIPSLDVGVVIHDI